MNRDELKRNAARAALGYISNSPIIGVGTGTTVNYFIDFLAEIRANLDGAVSSSETSTQRLRQVGIPVFELNAVGELDVYIDGADEINANLELIKGGGGALTREKVIATASKRFVCIADDAKFVDILGGFPLPVEVIPMARSFVAREIVKLGGRPVWRENVITDNGNQILDVHHLSIMEPIKLEKTMNNIPGIVTVGLFALRPPDIVLLASDAGVRTLKRG